MLCTLLANSMVVHADETSWSINSVWAILSEKARVLLFGVHKDADTLEKILDPATFAGIVISDDAAVYANFTQAQKCWAHLLRKAIKLTLQEPKNAEYRQFTDRLLALYRSACRVQQDGRRSQAGRAQKVAELDDDIFDLCLPVWRLELPPLEEGPENDYRLLVNEVMRLMLDKQLFTFVTAEPAQQPNGACQPVAGTNNEAERTLRNPAAARDTGRANKACEARVARRSCERAGITACVLEDIHIHACQCHRRDRTMAASGRKLFQQAATEAEVESARPIDSRRTLASPRRLTAKRRVPPPRVAKSRSPRPSQDDRDVLRCAENGQLRCVLPRSRKRRFTVAITFTLLILCRIQDRARLQSIVPADDPSFLAWAQDRGFALLSAAGVIGAYASPKTSEGDRLS